MSIKRGFNERQCVTIAREIADYLEVMMQPGVRRYKQKFITLTEGQSGLVGLPGTRITHSIWAALDCDIFKGSWSHAALFWFRAD